MEPPDFESMNFTSEPAGSGFLVCEEWRNSSEGSVFHLSNIILFLGLMGGSAFYGILYLFTFLTLGFFLCTLWAWSDPCTADSFLWSLAQFGVCLGQALYNTYRLRKLSFDKDFQELYNLKFKKLRMSLTHFKKIVASCDGSVYTLEEGQVFAVEGRTTIDKLSLLLCGR